MHIKSSEWPLQGNQSVFWIRVSWLEVVADSYKAQLSDTDLHRLSNLHFNRQKPFLLSRLCWAHWCQQQGLDPKLTRIETGKWGQPYVVGPGSDEWGVSVTHKDHVAGLLIFPRGIPMALDVEIKKESAFKAFRSRLTDYELGLVDEGEDPLLCATLFWGAKEALSKITMTGIHVPKSWYEVAGVRGDAEKGEGTYRHIPEYQFLYQVDQNEVWTLCVPCETLKQ